MSSPETPPGPRPEEALATLKQLADVFLQGGTRRPTDPGPALQETGPDLGGIA
jgi:hypothetical protein